MVENSVGSIIVGIRPTNNTKDRKVLTVSPSNSIENTKPSNSEGDNTNTNTTCPGIAIGCIASIELVAATNVVEPWLGNDVIKKDKVEVTRHGEHIVDADLDKAVSQMAAQCGIRGGNDGRRVRVLDGGRTILRRAANIVVAGLACFRLATHCVHVLQIIEQKQKQLTEGNT